MGANGIPDIWTGPGSFTHSIAPWAIDPWYKLPVLDVLGCYAGTLVTAAFSRSCKATRLSPPRGGRGDRLSQRPREAHGRAYG